MGFFNFLKKESVEERALSLMEGIVKASSGIYEGILEPNLECDSSAEYAEYPVFLGEGATYTREKASFAMVEITLYVYFRVDYELCPVKDSLFLRKTIGDLCFQDVFACVDADEQVRAKQIDIRLSRYANTANALKKDICQGLEFYKILNELSFGLIKRAINANNITEWHMHEKTVIRPLGLIERMMIAPDIAKMEGKYIGPLVFKALKKC
ncbi:hypothetical protein MASR1M66_24750 [Aminivibrio sp.]